MAHANHFCVQIVSVVLLVKDNMKCFFDSHENESIMYPIMHQNDPEAFNLLCFKTTLLTIHHHSFCSIPYGNI